MAESINTATISLDEAVELAQNEDGNLGIDSESVISEDDDDSSFVNHDSDWVSKLTMAKFYTPFSLTYSIRFVCFRKNQARNLRMNLQKSQKSMLQLHFTRKE